MALSKRWCVIKRRHTVFFFETSFFFAGIAHVIIKRRQHGFSFEKDSKDCASSSSAVTVCSHRRKSALSCERALFRLKQ
jgi:hypothetical protein